MVFDILKLMEHHTNFLVTFDILQTQLQEPSFVYYFSRNVRKAFSRKINDVRWSIIG